MRMKGSSRAIVKVSAGGIGVALAAMASYQVREAVAALIIFSVVLSTVGTVLLVLILIQKAALEGVIRLEGSVARVRARHAAPRAQVHNFARRLRF